MKKSLSVVLAAALAFGSMSSMAFAADNALTASDKYKQLVDKGILKGTTTGSDELDSNLTRAQFATIAIALAGIQEDTGSTSSFTDVTTKQWWFGAIEAAAKAELVKGIGNDKFAPREEVTVESVIVVAARIAKLTPVEGAKVEGASEWAAGYVQAAIDAGLSAARTDYTKPATRGQTAELAFAVYGALNPVAPEKVSVAKAEATGIKTVTVTLDKAVDTAKATFTLKKGTVSVTLDTVKWSEDKKVATLPLKDVKISEGEYTVTLGGVDAASVANASAKFTATNEAVKSIDFVTSVSEIAYTAKAKVKVAPKNQYNELASFPSSYYSVFTGYNNTNERITKNDAGELVVVLDTNVTGITQGVSQIPLTVYFNETRLTASKTFKVGNAPFITKMELKDVKYDGNKTSLTNAGEVATVPINLFDQYGNPLTGDQITLTSANFNSFITPQPNKLTAVTNDYNSDNEFETKVTLGGKEAKSATYTLTVYAGGTSATKEVKVTNGKVATKLAFGEFTKTIAEGDTATNFYVPVIGYDVDGNQLTKDELVDAVNVARIVPSVSGPIGGYRFVTTGPNKGSIEIQGVTSAALAKQVIFVSASITQIDAQDYKTMSINIQDKRVPETLVIDSAAKPKAVLGADSEFVILIKDQYGEKFTNLTGHRIDVTFTNLDGATSGTTLVAKDAANTVVGTRAADSGVFSYAVGQGAAFNAGFKFNTAPNAFGAVQFKAELIKLPAGSVTTDTSLKVVTQTIQSIDPTKVDLTYALANLGNLYAARDSGLFAGTTTADAIHIHKQVKIAVKDSAGNEVAFPEQLVQNVTVSNGVAVETGATAATNTELPSVNKATYYVLGKKAGEATVNATVYSAKGEIVHTSGTVTVKTDAVTVETISAGNGDKDVSAGTHNAYDLMDLKVVDNYGIEYKTTNIAAYSQLIGVTYAVTNVKGTGTVSLNSATGVITISGSVDEFVLTANAPNGKSASTLVY